jgi:NAD(P)H-hydrate epimerase
MDFGVIPMYLSREQVRALDRRAIQVYGVPGPVLMENAGRGAAELLLALGINGKVVICCGKGNNGGDGYVIARHLDNGGAPVKILLFAHPQELTGDAAIAYRIVAMSELPLAVFDRPPFDVEELNREFADADWIVDALCGTGLQGPMRPPMDQAVDAINASGARVLAVDLPSGLDCDTGLPLGPTVRAHHTATFVAMKKGFADPAAAPWLGQVHVVDIGVPRRLLEEALHPSGGGDAS